MHALSSALSKSATKCENSTCTCTWTIEEKISVVGEFLNYKLHDLASTMIQNDKREPLDYQSLDIDKRMELVDPTLTRHIQTLTKSCNEKKQQGTADEHSMSTHTKKVCRFYCSCVLLFCMNNRCCMPLHALLTDTVKYYGGSSELIRVLNSMGAVASEDTHSRLVTYTSLEREKGR